MYKLFSPQFAQKIMDPSMLYLLVAMRKSLGWHNDDLEMLPLLYKGQFPGSEKMCYEAELGILYVNNNYFSQEEYYVLLSEFLSNERNKDYFHRLENDKIKKIIESFTNMHKCKKFVSNIPQSRLMKDSLYKELINMAPYLASLSNLPLDDDMIDFLIKKTDFYGFLDLMVGRFYDPKLENNSPKYQEKTGFLFVKNTIKKAIIEEHPYVPDNISPCQLHIFFTKEEMYDMFSIFPTEKKYSNKPKSKPKRR